MSRFRIEREEVPPLLLGLVTALPLGAVVSVIAYRSAKRQPDTTKEQQLAIWAVSGLILSPILFTGQLLLADAFIPDPVPRVQPNPVAIEPIEQPKQALEMESELLTVATGPNDANSLSPSHQVFVREVDKLGDPNLSLGARGISSDLLADMMQPVCLARSSGEIDRIGEARYIDLTVAGIQSGYAGASKEMIQDTAHAMISAAGHGYCEVLSGEIPQ